MGKGELQIFLGASLFAFIPVAISLDPASSMVSLLTGRLVVAVVVLGIIKGKGLGARALNKSQFIKLTVWSVLMLGAMLSYFYAIAVTGMAVSASLLGMQPLLLVLMSVVFLKERLSILAVAGALLTLVGVYLITSAGLSGNNFFLYGMVAAIFSAFLLGLIFVFQKKHLMEIDAMDAVFYQSLLQLPLLIPLFLFYPPQFSSDYFIAITLLGLVCTVGSYGLIYSGAKKVSTQKIGVLQCIEYVIPVFIGILIFNETPGTTVCVGSALILAASSMVMMKTKTARIYNPKRLSSI